jgi:sugar phosphate isomerase/epimerase
MPAPKSEARDTFQAEFTDADTEDLLKRAFRIARVLGTDVIRIFSYWRVEDPKKAYPFVRERLRLGAALAAEHGMILALENEHTCNVGTGEELGRLVRDIASPSLRAVWDPGNAALLGETPYPEGYAAVRGLIAHLHVKDLKLDREKSKFVWVPVGEGLIDYRGQFKSLFDDGYEGTISLETHYRRADGNVRESTREALVGLLGVLDQVA